MTTHSKGSSFSKIAMSEASPFLVSLLGVVLDYATTCIGLSRGFYETHSQYSPVLALMIFWGALSILSLVLPRRNPWKSIMMFIALWSFLGAVNNSLVLLGVFPGLVI